PPMQECLLRVPAAVRGVAGIRPGYARSGVGPDPLPGVVRGPGGRQRAVHHGQGGSCVMGDMRRLLYTQAEAAAQLGVSVKTLLAEVRAGRLRYVLIGKRRKFAVADLERYITERGQTWRSADARVRRTGTTISRCKVVGFEEARRRRPALTPR